MKGVIVIPYRNREEHLSKFLKAQLHWPIIIVEQADKKPFNRGKLLNIGYQLATEFDYVIFHDVDMIPVRVDYSYPENPTHLATMASQFRFRMPYPEYFGGVTAFNRKDFEIINGFPNSFLGWGGEDDELHRRCLDKNLEIKRRLCIFKSLDHKRELDHDLHQSNVNKLTQPIDYNDGLNSLEYKLISAEKLSDKHTIFKAKI